MPVYAGPMPKECGCPVLRATKDIISGWTWTSASGLAWGCLRDGFETSWGDAFMDGVAKLPRSQDFLLAGSGGGPMSYSCVLGQLRRCLMCYAGLSAEQAPSSLFIA